MLNKVFAIGRAEYLEAVRSKAFLIGLLVMPVLMGGSVVVQGLLHDRVDLTERKCVVVDPTGELWPVLERAVAERNAAVWVEGDDGELEQKRPLFQLERYEPAAEEATDVVLSERVRDGEIQSFVLLSASVLDEDGEFGERPLAYHTQEPTFTELPDWIAECVNSDVRRRRFEGASIDRELVDKLNRRIPLTTWGLARQRDDGTVEAADEENKIRTFLIPAAAMMLLFMIIMTSAPQLMNQVLEEKMQRISEVLVSSVSPFELMLGKLVGSACVCMTLAAVYLSGIAWATHHFGVAAFVPPSAYVWFLVMVVFALLMYGSIFSALGSACSELRDAQSMMMPAMIVIMIPLFAWSAVLESPNGSIAQALTYVPTATPMILMIRVLAPPGPPVWELFAGFAMCIATTLVVVWAAGKIFRVGVLSQGQTPSFRKLFTWIVSK